jgi:hypothetical protein
VLGHDRGHHQNGGSPESPRRFILVLGGTPPPAFTERVRHPLHRLCALPAQNERRRREVQARGEQAPNNGVTLHHLFRCLGPTKLLSNHVSSNQSLCFRETEYREQRQSRGNAPEAQSGYGRDEGRANGPAKSAQIAESWESLRRSDGKPNLAGRDKGVETAQKLQGRNGRDVVQNNPANSAPVGENREISPKVGMRGGPGRTRTSNQAVMSTLTSRENSIVFAISAAIRHRAFSFGCCVHSLVGPRGGLECQDCARASVSLGVARTVYFQVSRQRFHAVQSAFLVAAYQPVFFVMRRRGGKHVTDKLLHSSAHDDYSPFLMCALTRQNRLNVRTK